MIFDNGIKILKTKAQDNGINLFHLKYNDCLDLFVWTRKNNTFISMYAEHCSSAFTIPQTIAEALLINGNQKAFSLILEIVEFANEENERKLETDED